MNKINKFPKLIHYDDDGYSIHKFPKDDFWIKIRIVYLTSTIFIVREDNLLTLFKKKFKTKNKNTLKKQAKVCVMKFCNIELPKKRYFSRRGKYVRSKI